MHAEIYNLIESMEDIVERYPLEDLGQLELELRRYYKSDWSGWHINETYIAGEPIQITSLNCMNAESLDSIFSNLDKIESFLKMNENKP